MFDALKYKLFDFFQRLPTSHELIKLRRSINHGEWIEVHFGDFRPEGTRYYYRPGYGEFLRMNYKHRAIPVDSIHIETLTFWANKKQRQDLAKLLLKETMGKPVRLLDISHAPSSVRRLQWTLKRIES